MFKKKMTGLILLLAVLLLGSSCKGEDPQEAVARQFLTNFYTSNLEGRYDGYLKFQERINAGETLSPEEIEQEIRGYHRSIGDLMTEEGLFKLIKNDFMVVLDKTMTQKNHHTVVKEVKPVDAGEAKTIENAKNWTYEVKVEILDEKDEVVGESIQKGSLILSSGEDPKILSFHQDNMEDFFK